MLEGFTTVSPESTVLKADELPLTLIIAPGYTHPSAAQSRLNKSTAVTRVATITKANLDLVQEHLINWYYGINFTKL